MKSHYVSFSAKLQFATAADAFLYKNQPVCVMMLQSVPIHMHVYIQDGQPHAPGRGAKATASSASRPEQPSAVCPGCYGAATG